MGPTPSPTPISHPAAIPRPMPMGAPRRCSTDLTGQPAVVTDPLGDVSRVTYNASGQIVLTSLPGGTASSDKYDAKGNLTSQTDPLGNTSQFTTDPQTGELESFQNADGATTGFNYTSQGEPCRRSPSPTAPPANTSLIRKARFGKHRRAGPLDLLHL